MNMTNSITNTLTGSKYDKPAGTGDEGIGKSIRGQQGHNTATNTSDNEEDTIDFASETYAALGVEPCGGETAKTGVRKGRGRTCDGRALGPRDIQRRGHKADRKDKNKGKIGKKKIDVTMEENVEVESPIEAES